MEKDLEKVFVLNVDEMFGAIMSINVRLCAVLMFTSVFFSQGMDFFPSMIGLIFVLSVLFLAIWTFLALKLKSFFVRVTISPEGIRSRRQTMFYSYCNLAWSDVKKVVDRKFLGLTFLRIFSEDQSVVLGFPFHLKSENQFIDSVQEFAGKDNPLSVYFQKLETAG